MKLYRPLLIAICCVALAGCTSAKPSAPATFGPSPEAETADGAKIAATTFVKTFSAGDWAGAWDLFDAKSQAAISRTDFGKFRTACPGAVGIAITVDNLRMENPTTAVAQVSRAGISTTYIFVYEGGKWRYQLDPDQLTEYSVGADGLIAKRKAEGTC